jgi:hypothetical protein
MHVRIAAAAMPSWGQAAWSSLTSSAAEGVSACQNGSVCGDEPARPALTHCVMTISPLEEDSDDESDHDCLHLRHAADGNSIGSRSDANRHLI